MTGPRHSEPDLDMTTSPEADRSDVFDALYTNASPPSQARIVRHSSFVSIMKIALPLTAIALFITVLIYSGIFDKRDRLDITFREIAQRNDDLRMVSPRITGLDRSGQPYLLTADTATQGNSKPNEIALENVQADLKLSSDGEWISVSSTTGLLDTESQDLALQQKIDVYLSSGYEFHASEGLINFKDGTFTSTSEVEGHGPAGTLRADAMTADNDAGKMIFTGRVKMKLYGKP